MRSEKAGRREGNNTFWALYIMPGTVLDVFIHCLFYLGLTLVHAEPGSDRLSDQPQVGQPLGD